MANLLILFDSDTGATEMLSLKSKEILEILKNEVRVRRVESIESSLGVSEIEYKSTIDVVSANDLKWADAYIISCPIHSGTITASLKYFFDQHHNLAAEGVFLNKPATAMTIGKLAHAGAETTIQHLFAILMQFGSLIVSTSIASSEILKDNGNPYGLSFILDAQNSFGDEKIWIEILTNHFGRFSKIAEATKDLNATDSFKEQSHLPYTISGALG